MQKMRSVHQCKVCGNQQPMRLTITADARPCQRCGGATGPVQVPLHSLAEVGVRTGSGLNCPKCGGAQFKATRTGAWKWGLAGGIVATVATGGAAAPVLAASAATAKAKRVTCVTCGEVYDRRA